MFVMQWFKREEFVSSYPLVGYLITNEPKTIKIWH